MEVEGAAEMPQSSHGRLARAVIIGVGESCKALLLCICKPFLDFILHPRGVHGVRIRTFCWFWRSLVGVLHELLAEVQG